MEIDDGLEIIIEFDEIVNIDIYINISSILINIFINWLFTLIIEFYFVKFNNWFVGR